MRTPRLGRRRFMAGVGLAVPAIVLPRAPDMARSLSQVDARLTTEINTRAGQLAGTISSTLRSRIEALEAKAPVSPDLQALKDDVAFLMAIVCPPKP